MGSYVSVLYVLKVSLPWKISSKMLHADLEKKKGGRADIRKQDLLRDFECRLGNDFRSVFPLSARQMVV